jgi:hypothetical protein
MADKKPLLDITYHGGQKEKVEKNFSLLYDRLLATAMDYDFYLESKVNNKELHARRNNVIYRLDCLIVQLKWLHEQMLVNDNLSNSILSFNSKNRGSSMIPFSTSNNLKISLCFDNIIFNSVSLFDYISSYIYFICTNQKDVRIDWPKISRSARDQKNVIGKLSIALIIDEIDREFVGKLYDYRSHVIHKTSDHGASNFQVSYGRGGETAKNQYYLSLKFITTFSELRKLNQVHSISLMYGAVWLVNKVFYLIDKILFGLKRYMEQNRVVANPTIFLKKDSDMGEKEPKSRLYWNLDAQYDLD